MRIISRVLGLLALLASLTAGASVYEPTTLFLLRRVFAETSEGQALARALLGTPTFNPGGVDEVLQTLMHPRNTAIRNRLLGRIHHIKTKIDPRAELSLLKNETATQLTPESLGLQEIQILSAREARSAIFTMGREPAPVRAPVEAFGPRATGVRDHPLEQLLIWEETANVRDFRETTQFFGLEVDFAPREGTQLKFSTEASGELRALLHAHGGVAWPKHPYASERGDIPRFDSEHKELWPARFTASRSLVVWNRIKGQAFSIKLPTDQPHLGHLQTDKAFLRGDLRNALARTEHIRRQDARLGPDSRIGILKDVATVKDIDTQNGYVIRDLSPLLDGHYYFPALAIPYEGEWIAKLHGSTLIEFWGKHYAEALGIAKARLLLRYGLQMVTPNAQNMLIQLDRQLRPTGKIIFRDLSDSEPVGMIAKCLGMDDLLALERRQGSTPGTRLAPEAENSFWRFDEDPVHSIHPDFLIDWAMVHDVAYAREILRALGAEIDPIVSSSDPIGGLQRYLRSDVGKNLLFEYGNRRNRGQ